MFVTEILNDDSEVLPLNALLNDEGLITLATKAGPIQIAPIPAFVNVIEGYDFPAGLPALDDIIVSIPNFCCSNASLKTVSFRNSICINCSASVSWQEFCCLPFEGEDPWVNKDDFVNWTVEKFQALEVFASIIYAADLWTFLREHFAPAGAQLEGEDDVYPQH